jgi:Holliday junction DNA helicase RuvA
MIFTLKGVVTYKDLDFFVLDVHGVGYKISSPHRFISKITVGLKDLLIFTRLYVRETALEIYGFPNEEELRFFELLNTVGGIGPKSALAVLDVAEIKDLAAAITEGRSDLFSSASGVGKKTAERIVLELKNKVSSERSGEAVLKMEVDKDLIETLVGLGYGREEGKRALEVVPGEISDLEDRLKLALKNLSAKKHAR